MHMFSGKMLNWAGLLKLAGGGLEGTSFQPRRGCSVIGRVLGFGDSGHGSIPGRGFDLRGGLYVQIGIPLLSH